MKCDSGILVDERKTNGMLIEFVIWVRSRSRKCKEISLIKICLYTFGCVVIIDNSINNHNHSNIN